jgi:hypothetical protein
MSRIPAFPDISVAILKPPMLSGTPMTCIYRPGSFHFMAIIPEGLLQVN